MTFTPDNSIVWSEIPVRDIDQGIAFYSQVFDYALTKDESGPNPMAMFPESTMMSLGVPDPQQRADLIAFLEQASVRGE